MEAVSFIYCCFQTYNYFKIDLQSYRCQQNQISINRCQYFKKINVPIKLCHYLNKYQYFDNLMSRFQNVPQGAQGHPWHPKKSSEKIYIHKTPDQTPQRPLCYFTTHANISMFMYIYQVRNSMHTHIWLFILFGLDRIWTIHTCV